MSLKPSRDLLGDVEQCMWSSPGLRLKFFLGSAATSVDHLKEFATSGMDALMYCGLKREMLFNFMKAYPEHPPIVLVTSHPIPDEKFRRLGNNGGVVMLDSEQIGRRAAAFFVSRGLRNFAFLGRNGERDNILGRIRCGAFEDGLKEALGTQMTFERYKVGEYRANEDYWEAGDRDQAVRWVRALPKPCGIFVDGDHVAFRLAEMCRKFDIDVPGEVEILGLNNNDGFCELAMPAVSFIFPDLDACAKEAVNLAVALAKKTNLPPNSRMIKVASNFLTERGTTAIGRGYGRVAARACEFIRQNACKGIMVSDVSRHLGVSRRTLEVRVREATGMSVLSLIRDVRMDEVCRLLTTTDMSISEVTLRSGYQLTTNLSVIFKKRYGMTMRAYRAANR